MTILDTLITDRTQADVSRWETLRAKGWSLMTEAEREEWTGPMKGAYNASDLNRVTEAMDYLAGEFRSYGYSITLTPVRGAAWTEEDIPTTSEMTTYLANLRKLREVFAVLSTTPEAPETMAKLTYQGANDIEQILRDVGTVIERVIGSFHRSGQFTFWSGYLPLPASRSDLGRNWEELDAMHTTWANWQLATWYLLLYGDLTEEGEVV